MNGPDYLVPLYPSPYPETQGERTPSRKHWRRFLWLVILIGICSILLLSVWVVFFPKGSQPLRADRKTLYLVNSSQDLSVSSLPSQWHWDKLDLPGALFVVAPYHPSGEALEVDVQIKDTGEGFQNDSVFGIVVAMNSQGAGYVCGVTLGQPILSYPGWDQHTIQRETTSDVSAVFSHYVTVTVTIQNNVITLFYDGERAAQATVSTSLTNGLIGLFSDSSAKVQSFRIEQLS